MFSKLQIVNIGLSKIASSRVEQLNPPRSSLERFVAENYDHWKRSEISKRRWVFALEDEVQLTLVATVSGRGRPYKYALPPEALRPVREKETEWQQRGRFIWSAYTPLAVQLIMNVDEPDFDPMFVEVLACRIADECVEYVTQSNTKTETSSLRYDKAVADAGKNNAFIIGPEDVTSDDNDFPFLTARF